MTTIPTIEPLKFTKGDSVSWTKSLADYSAADSWVLTYYIRGAAVLDKAASASGSDFLIELTTAETDTLTAGDYKWIAKVSKGSELITIATGQFVVEVDLADSLAGFESRPHCKIMLDAIESLLQGKASQDVSSYSIQGRSLTRMTIDELETWRSKYRNEWRVYQNKINRLNGKNKSNKVSVRFNT